MATVWVGMHRQPTGVLVFNEDGRMWTQCHEPNTDGGRFTATTVTVAWRWPGFLGYFPHGTVPHVEMHVRARQPRARRQTTQQYELSLDGSTLTTSDVRILFGERTAVERLEWRRLAM